jgi:hypothetical protein
MFEGGLTRRDGVDVEAAFAEAVAQEQRGVLFVVDDKNVSGHVGILPFSRQKALESFAAQAAGRRPTAKLTIAMMSATTKMIFAMPTALAASPKNPNTAAISAMMKNANAQENMADSFAERER